MSELEKLTEDERAQLQDIADGSQGREAAMQKAKRADKSATSVLNCGSTSMYVQFTSIAATLESPWTIARRGGAKEPTYVVVDRAPAAAAEPSTRRSWMTTSSRPSFAMRSSMLERFSCGRAEFERRRFRRRFSRWHRAWPPCW